MRLLHLTSSRFFGGPERQMLGLAVAMRGECDSRFASFSESGLCRAFLEQVANAGFEATELNHDTPKLIAACGEVAELLAERQIELLICHGYKAGLLGLIAARRLGIPVVGVSRGWTAETFRVRVYEWLDRRVLRRVDRAVCVSEAQAAKVRRAGVASEKIVVIPNSVDVDRFKSRSASAREEMAAMFAVPPRTIIGAAGRLSPEKGFDVLVSAAAAVVRETPDVGFVLFGDGPLRETLACRIAELGLTDAFVLAGFRGDLDRYLPHFDLFVQSSHTEGMPNVILESLAAGVPVVATAVGGTPELIADGENGVLTPANDASALADAISRTNSNPAMCAAMTAKGRQRVAERFTFSAQAAAYQRLARELVSRPPAPQALSSRASEV